MQTETEFLQHLKDNLNIGRPTSDIKTLINQRIIKIRQNEALIIDGVVRRSEQLICPDCNSNKTFWNPAEELEKAKQLRDEFHERARKNKQKFDLLIKLKKEIFGDTKDSIEDDYFTLNLFEYAEAYHRHRVNEISDCTHNDKTWNADAGCMVCDYCNQKC